MNEKFDNLTPDQQKNVIELQAKMKQEKEAAQAAELKKPKPHAILLNALQTLLNQKDNQQVGLAVDFANFKANLEQFKSYLSMLIDWNRDDFGVNKLYAAINAVDERLSEAYQILEQSTKEIVSSYNFTKQE